MKMSQNRLLSENYIREMAEVMECIHVDNLQQARVLADTVQSRFDWTNDSMDADAVELMNLVQEYLDGLGYENKESLLTRYWTDIGRANFPGSEM